MKEMQFIDSHTHLYLPEFDNDRDEVIERALGSGIKKMLLPNIDRESIEPMMSLADSYRGICLPMIGVHPTSIKDDYREHLEAVKAYIERHKFIAIGEIGIDLYWDRTYIRQQEETFTEQLELAGRENLPVVIHSRESLPEILRIIDRAAIAGLRGVFHAFTGSVEEAREIIERGFLLGIGGVLTFKNSNLDRTLELIDIKNIILETDSPFLAPAPKRGKRNESSYIRFIADKLAQVKKMPVEDIAGISTENCNKLFNLD